MFKNAFKILLIILSAAGGLMFFSQPTIAGSQTTSSVVITVCGNDIIETGEQCEGVNLNGASCVSRGYISGTLTCAACQFDTSNCVSSTPTPPGGGGWVPLPPPQTKVILQGKSHPGARLSVLKDGQVASISQADSGTNFKVEITDITAGTYTFGIWAEDSKGLKSITFNFTVNVMANAITTISGIFIPPTIATTKENYGLDETVDIYGQTVPLSRIEVYVGSNNPNIYIADADNTGIWDYKIAAVDLGEGSHLTKARATGPGGLLSTFSQSLAFGIGKAGQAPPPAGLCSGADLNHDGKVGLIDFSILLYWWGSDNECADQNYAGKVDIIDFSIMMYYWTG